MTDLETALRESLQRHAAEAPGAAPASARLLADVRRRRATNSALLSAATIVAVLAVVLVGPLAVTRNQNTTGPTDPAAPTSTPTQEPAPSPSMVNGRIQTIDEYLAQAGAACNGCYWPGSAFDQQTGTLLVIDSSDSGPAVTGIRLITANGVVADLDCPDDFACPQSYLALGPGPNEFSALADAGHVDVLAFDGRVQDRIDVSAAIGEADGAFVSALAWSPDGSRLAVRTGGAGHVRLWLFDRDGGGPQLVYTASSTDTLPRLALSGVSWSPDGSRLGFVEEHWNMAAELGRPESEISESAEAVSLLVPDPGQDATGTATTLYTYPKRPSDAQYDGPTEFLWSPDGARVGIRVYDQVLELSAEDGTVLVEHPLIEGLLIWPAEQP